MKKNPAAFIFIHWEILALGEASKGDAAALILSLGCGRLKRVLPEGGEEFDPAAQSMWAAEL
jgi:hypothetical protein